MKKRVAYIRSPESGDGRAGYYAAQRLATSLRGGTGDWLNARKSSWDLPAGSLGYESSNEDIEGGELR